jgi:DNA polymerase-3 subunit epsilon
MSGDAVTKLMLGTAAVIDVETTGLNPHRDEIVELAITLFRYDRVKGQVLEVVSEYSGLREPSCPIRRDATAVHGITRRMVQGLKLNYPRVRAMLREADFLVAHNAEFDRGFVERLAPSLRNRTWFCSLNGIDWEARGFASRRLEDLAAAHRIENPNHDAANRTTAGFPTNPLQIYSSTPNQWRPQQFGARCLARPYRSRYRSDCRARLYGF